MEVGGDARIALMGVQERMRCQDWCLALEDLKHEVDVTVRTGTGLGHKLAWGAAPPEPSPTRYGWRRRLTGTFLTNRRVSQRATGRAKLRFTIN